MTGHPPPPPPSLERGSALQVSLRSSTVTLFRFEDPLVVTSLYVLGEGTTARCQWQTKYRESLTQRSESQHTQIPMDAKVPSGFWEGVLEAVALVWQGAGVNAGQRNFCALPQKNFGFFCCPSFSAFSQKIDLKLSRPISYCHRDPEPQGTAVLSEHGASRPWTPVRCCGCAFWCSGDGCVNVHDARSAWLQCIAGGGHCKVHTCSVPARTSRASATPTRM